MYAFARYFEILDSRFRLIVCCFYVSSFLSENRHVAFGGENVPQGNMEGLQEEYFRRVVFSETMLISELVSLKAVTGFILSWFAIS